VARGLTPFWRTYGCTWTGNHGSLDGAFSSARSTCLVSAAPYELSLTMRQAMPMCSSWAPARMRSPDGASSPATPSWVPPHHPRAWSARGRVRFLAMGGECGQPCRAGHTPNLTHPPGRRAERRLPHAPGVSVPGIPSSTLRARWLTRYRFADLRWDPCDHHRRGAITTAEARDQPVAAEETPQPTKRPQAAAT
jgi:hypothetical protein